MPSPNLGPVALMLLGFAAAPFVRAQSIHVDVTPSHVANIIKPTEALGAGIDRLPYGAADKLFVADTIKQTLSAGWQTVTYRQNTELHIEAWHWNPQGSWSDPAGKGYFTGGATPGTEMIRHSYGYPLPHRGVTRDDGTDMNGYSRLTDGDENSYWKSNPYLSQPFTGEDDALHPQWVFLDLSSRQDITAIRIAWAEPFATKYVVQYWTGEDPIRKPVQGSWQAFPGGVVTNGKGGNVTLQLATTPISVQWVRIWMTASSNTCDTHGSADKRNCLGYAIREIYLGTTSADEKFHDGLRHTPDQDQTATYCSSVDPWHEPGDLAERAGDQIGFDLFYASGITRGLPAMIPIAMLYGTPEDATAEIAYIEKRGYPISYVEMGEEPDGHYTLPEDYAALYVQFAAALHRVDPKLRLGGPIFTGENKDIEVWPDADGKASFTGRFIDYLKAHGKLTELAFFSFEHYPIDPGKVQWSSLYDEANLVQKIMKVWREDGVPASVPFFITESNLSSASSEAYMDIFGGLWLADYIGAFLAGGGEAVYYFHYLPEPLGRGHNNSPGTFGLFLADREYKLKQPLSQYFVSQLINLEWVQPGDGFHKAFPAASDLRDDAGHTLVTTYAVLRPDGQWSLLVVNKDQENAHTVNISFDDATKKAAGFFAGPVSVTTFGKAQYAWHPNLNGGTADPDGPAAKSTVRASAGTTFTLPAASVTVIRGSVEAPRPAPK
ncbi:MAG TPA: discoidin domain-containing protein [Candidatus Acidoferrum sp.]|nr:discoidin domain-containing protein [Candidatus Acidoferrum sp.]